MRWQVKKRQQLAPFIAEQLGCSNKSVRKQLALNCCNVNGHIERFGSIWINPGDCIDFTPLEASSNTQWKVLFENEDLKIFDKPAGWICHPNDLKKTFQEPLFLVHRLDKDTTGVLIVAKNQKVQKELMLLFKTRKVRKEYIALVDGIVQRQKGVQKSYLCKKGFFQGQTIYGSGIDGEYAETQWEVVARNVDTTLVKCFPITGRTHQIRVHFAEMGHPIIIDRQYAKTFLSKKKATRPLLHAYRIYFTYSGGSIDVSSGHNF